ncbi:hypothetical protein [Carboxylicivirga taeanensis]|uniref:hypothetical protein n=1 Tax=Carboxylicivirga taeanensis TaxID=1416875 RepID=UPI003F6E1C71
MVIYGWKSSPIKTEGNTQLSCPHCSEKGQIVNSIFGRYVHIFWIPVFSIGKTGAAQCMHCKKTFVPKEMDNDMKRAYKTMKSDTKIPFWHFSGLAIIAIIIALASYSGSVNAQNEQVYIDSPQAGDVYEYKNGPKRYSTMKVVEVSEDSVYFRYNNYDYTKRSGIEEIDVDTCYTEDIYMLSREEIKSMYTDGTIYDINR